MKAVQISATGASSVLTIVSKQLPSVGSLDLLVKTSFAGVNYIDTYHRSGTYPLKALPWVLGLEGVGLVTATGDAVTKFKPGDRVAWPTAVHSYAEYVSLHEDKAVLVPEEIEDSTACAAMLQGLTAHFLVTSAYQIKQNDYALVHAAAGGVGLLLVQMIKARGGIVIATCSTEHKAAITKAAGADFVIVGYDNFTARAREYSEGHGVHVVYDGVGKDTFTASLDSIRRRGMMVLFGGASGQVPSFDLQGLASRGSLFITRPTLFDYITTPEELQWRAREVFEDVLAKKLTLQIGAIYHVDQVKDCHDDLQARKTTGKLLLQF